MRNGCYDPFQNQACVIGTLERSEQCYQFVQTASESVCTQSQYNVTSDNVARANTALAAVRPETGWKYDVMSYR